MLAEQLGNVVRTGISGGAISATSPRGCKIYFSLYFQPVRNVLPEVPIS
jgi:hypothetical protein